MTRSAVTLALFLAMPSTAVRAQPDGAPCSVGRPSCDENLVCCTNPISTPGIPGQVCTEGPGWDCGRGPVEESVCRSCDGDSVCCKLVGPGFNAFECRSLDDCFGLGATPQPPTEPPSAGLEVAAWTSSELRIDSGTLSSFQSYDHIEALFGVPAYGDSVSERLYYAESTLCAFDAEDARRGYPLRNYDDEGKQLPWPSPFVFMVDRGECTFVTKVRNAQRHGAAAVIIADNSCLCDDEDAGECLSDPNRACETRKPVMADDGSGADIAIPSVLIFKQDADLVKADAQANKPVMAIMSWPLPVADDRVEYELWTAPTDESSKDFIREFKEAAVALGDRAYFTPQMYLFDGIRSGCHNAPLKCYNLCANSGRYCLTDPDNGLDRGISGADVVAEGLRRTCIWRLYGQEDGIGVPWWAYVNIFSKRCDTEELFSNKQCIADAMAATRVIDAGEVEQCMFDSGGLEGDVENLILEQQLRAKEKTGVVLLPTMFANGVFIRNATLDFAVAFEAICAGYAPGTAPSICTTCPTCNDLKACISNGGCESNLFAPSPAGADPPMGDPAAMQPSYLHEIPPFTMVLGFPRDVELSASTVRELEDITSAFLQDYFDEASGYVTALQADEIDHSSLESSIKANQTANQTEIGSMQGLDVDLHFIEVSGIVLLREAMDKEATAEFVTKSLGAAFQRREGLLNGIQASSSSDLQSASFVELSASFDVCPNGLRCNHGSRCAVVREGFACDCSIAPTDVYDAVDGIRCEFAATEICLTDADPMQFCVNGGECIELTVNLFGCNCPNSFEGDRCELLPEEPAADSSMNTSEEAASQSSFPSAGDIAIFVIMGVGLLLTTLIVAYSVKKKRSPQNESEPNAANNAAAPTPANATVPARDEEVGLPRDELNSAATAEGTAEEEKEEEIASPGDEDFETTQIDEVGEETKEIQQPLQVETAT